MCVNLETNNKPLDIEPLKKETCLSGLELQGGASASQQTDRTSGRGTEEHQLMLKTEGNFHVITEQS